MQAVVAAIVEVYKDTELETPDSVVATSTQQDRPSATTGTESEVLIPYAYTKGYDPPFTEKRNEQKRCGWSSNVRKHRR